uniref:Uncharacterized protein n=1 Tax=Anguilla anguilla TaxID=7936 RepID=A0A0E9TZW5_ANGAN
MATASHMELTKLVCSCSLDYIDGARHSSCKSV